MPKGVYLRKPITEEHRENKRKSMLGKNLAENNGMWKGDEVGYYALHNWIRRRIPKPKLCVDCKKVPPYDLTNISQQYKRDVNDFEWLCRKCHQTKDGRLERLRSLVKKGRISPFKGKKHTEETKRKISLAKKGKK